ncbi:tumor necrosis factor ligand superfamily member 10 isoform X2 [Tachysurus fulvidraco]|uniref:tumor necrosis factor ligand superfamily member 10 isoform X2 n=1 Tax=Tachysurus fulvidraco TaxID=1234273 RepID=UPI000F4EC4AD|nr:tumor necrosis factor ligand superfamily member 10 isoform X2 [Tachysurus fulvidraco]
MAANDYHGYLRNHMDMENGGSRFQPPTQSAHKPLIFGTLAVMGLLQVASSVTILLHLTGYLREEVHSEPIIAGAFRDIKKKEKPRKKDQIPIAHLSVKTPMDFASTDSKVVTTIQWNQNHGTLIKVNYHDGRFVMKEQGLYYAYCKTCFRYAPDHASKKQDVSNVQLIQYIFHESHTQSNLKPVLLSKSGGTFNWSDPKYNMYCVQQGRSVRLGESDGLFVNVSNSWLLDPEPEGTYFGVFKMNT